MEYWNNGMLELKPVFHHSIIPFFGCSIVPFLLHQPSTALRRRSQNQIRFP
jgi:hypothetical protein